MHKICTFKIGKELFGVNILLVKEVSKLQEITQVPGAKEFHHGLMNLRGHVISLINPSLFVKEKISLDSEKVRILIFKTDELIANMVDKKLINKVALGQDFIGLIISSVSDVIQVELKDIMPQSPNLPDEIKNVTAGIIQMEKEIVLVLDLEKLFQKLQ